MCSSKSHWLHTYGFFQYEYNIEKGFVDVLGESAMIIYDILCITEFYTVQFKAILNHYLKKYVLFFRMKRIHHLDNVS